MNTSYYLGQSSYLGRNILIIILDRNAVASLRTFFRISTVITSQLARRYCHYDKCAYYFQCYLKIAQVENPKRYPINSLLKTWTKSFGNEKVKAVDGGK